MALAEERTPVETEESLLAIADLQVFRNVPLASYTRFGIGGPAAILAQTREIDAFLAALKVAQSSGMSWVIIGGGTNLVVSDAGFPGLVLKLMADRMAVDAGSADQASVSVEAGAVLQHLVDYTVDRGLAGLHTMTGIPGFTGAAIYGNAGAYGHSIQELVDTVRFFDGADIREFRNDQCEFHYRESVFKKHKDWIILSARLKMSPGNAGELREAADKIRAIRNKKYPPTMKCAGSIFKNYLLRELPTDVAAQLPNNVIIEGKVPSAWFLEQIGAKGMKAGDIHVADYHANLIYNAGNGTARELVQVISELKRRVRDRWNIPLEEEVQYVGFETS